MTWFRTGKTVSRQAAAGAAILALFALFFLPGAGRAEISVSATLSAVTFSVDDGARLTITVNDARSADLEIPPTQNQDFEIIQRGRSSQINIVNGRFSSAITFTCLVRAYKPGKYTIPPISVSADGTTRTTEPIPFEVTDSAAPGRGSSGTAVSPPSSGAGAAGGQTAFIRLSGTKTDSYIGEIIPVEVKAYFRKGLRATINSAPRLVGDGLVLPEPKEKPIQTQEVVSGTPYTVLSWQSEIANIKEGRHTVHLELDATLLIPERRMSTSLFDQLSPFDDDLFDNFFGGYNEKPLKVTSEEMVFTVAPLPLEGRPADFSGAIGDFNLQVSAAPVEAETGEPLTLTMTVGGRGNFDRVEAPVFPESEDWKTYTPSAKFTPHGDSGHAGDKVFEQAIVAGSSAVSEIPALSFSYFDPDKSRYITRRSMPIPVTITGKEPIVAAAPAPQSPATPQPGQAKAESLTGLAPLHLEAGRTTTVIEPLYSRPIFLASTALCALALLVFAGLKIFRLHQQGHPEELRKRRMSKALQASCTRLDQTLAAGDSAAFLAACRSIIQQHLGALWHCPAGAITRGDLAARLPDSSRLLEIFTVAEEAAYGGSSLDCATMEEYAAVVKSELEELL